MEQSIVCHFLYQHVFPILLYYSPVIFAYLLENDFKILQREQSVSSRVYSISPDEIFVILRVEQLSTWETFTHMVLSDSNPLAYDDLSKCPSDNFMRSIFCTLLSRINIYRNSTALYLGHILTYRTRVPTDFLSHLS